ncbi:MAG: serine/threonine protein kinase [Thermoleophilia bacterium]|nr:serine/threonine protein kinase [Thermoleophilia bacterium]
MSDHSIQIDGYEVFEELGHGGMGTVYRARQTFFDRDVALKVILPRLASDREFSARFRTEMRLAASIDHPNVVPVYDAGESNGNLYFAMKLIRGDDLWARIGSAGSLSPDFVVGVVEQVAGALDEAHGLEILHRDVKPSNVLLDNRTGGAYLSDFGIAKSMEAAQPLTETGFRAGALKYVSPERLKGEVPDARADVYSLGCVLFQALTGELPFEDKSDASIMFAKVNDDTRVPSDINPTLWRFDRVVSKALIADRNKRFSSAGELAVAARAALSGSDPTML